MICALFLDTLLSAEGRKKLLWCENPMELISECMSSAQAEGIINLFRRSGFFIGASLKVDISPRGKNAHGDEHVIKLLKRSLPARFSQNIDEFQDESRLSELLKDLRIKKYVFANLKHLFQDKLEVSDKISFHLWASGDISIEIYDIRNNQKTHKIIKKPSSSHRIIVHTANLFDYLLTFKDQKLHLDWRGPAERLDWQCARTISAYSSLFQNKLPRNPLGELELPFSEYLSEAQGHYQTKEGTVQLNGKGFLKYLEYSLFQDKQNSKSSDHAGASQANDLFDNCLLTDWKIDRDFNGNTIYTSSNMSNQQAKETKRFFDSQTRGTSLVARIYSTGMRNEDQLSVSHVPSFHLPTADRMLKALNEMLAKDKLYFSLDTLLAPQKISLSNVTACRFEKTGPSTYRLVKQEEGSDMKELLAPISEESLAQLYLNQKLRLMMDKDLGISIQQTRSILKNFLPGHVNYGLIALYEAALDKKDFQGYQELLDDYELFKPFIDDNLLSYYASELDRLKGYYFEKLSEVATDNATQRKHLHQAMQQYQENDDHEAFARLFIRLCGFKDDSIAQLAPNGELNLGLIADRVFEMNRTGAENNDDEAMAPSFP